jgi:uncharacterized protein YutE (UPF0331/DUF86 family)
MPKRKVPLNREVLQTRISYIEDSLRSLERFKGITNGEFHSNSDNFRIAFYDLHRALEAVMDIGTHILSRLPGARPTSYKDIPRLLERNKIVPADFATNALYKMAGYRNGMVHFYGEISEREIYDIVQKELDDFYIFLTHINVILENPAKFNLSIA